MENFPNTMKRTQFSEGKHQQQNFNIQENATTKMESVRESGVNSILGEVSFESHDSVESLMGFLDDVDPIESAEIQSIKEFLEKELTLSEQITTDVCTIVDASDSGFINVSDVQDSTNDFIKTDDTSDVMRQGFMSVGNNDSEIWVNDSYQVYDISDTDMQVENSLEAFNDSNEQFMFITSEDDDQNMMPNVEGQTPSLDISHNQGQLMYLKSDENKGFVISNNGNESKKLNISDIQYIVDGTTQMVLSANNDPNNSIMYVQAQENAFVISSVENDNINYNETCNVDETPKVVVNNITDGNEPVIFVPADNKANMFPLDNMVIPNTNFHESHNNENNTDTNEPLIYVGGEEKNELWISNTENDTKNLNISNMNYNASLNNNNNAKKEPPIYVPPNDFLEPNVKNPNEHFNFNECNINGSTEMLENNIIPPNEPFMFIQADNRNNMYMMPDFVKENSKFDKNLKILAKNQDNNITNTKFCNLDIGSMCNEFEFPQNNTTTQFDDDWFIVLNEHINAEMTKNNFENLLLSNAQTVSKKPSIAPKVVQKDVTLDNDLQRIESELPDLTFINPTCPNKNEGPNLNAEILLNESQINNNNNNNVETIKEDPNENVVSEEVIIEEEIEVEVITMKPNPALVQAPSSNAKKTPLVPLSNTIKSPPRQNKRKQPFVIKKGNHIIFDYKPKEDELFCKVSKPIKIHNYADENICEVDAIFNRAKKKGGAAAVVKPTKYRKNKKFDTLATKQPLHENINKRKTDDNNSLYASYDEQILVIERPKLTKMAEAVMLTAEDFANNHQGEKFGKCPKCAKIFISPQSILFHLGKCPVLSEDFGNKQ